MSFFTELFKNLKIYMEKQKTLKCQCNPEQKRTMLELSQNLTQMMLPGHSKPAW
jgi:hypothetical protein